VDKIESFIGLLIDDPFAVETNERHIVLRIVFLGLRKHPRRYIDTQDRVEMFRQRPKDPPYFASKIKSFAVRFKG
jgi:hypothetical protein